MPLSRDPKKRKAQLANRRDAPPPPKGNRHAVKHGGRARPDADRLAAIEHDIAESLPIRDKEGNAPIHDRATVRLVAITLARLETVGAYLDEHGLLFRDGRVRPATELEHQLVVRAGNLLDRLGCTPQSRAKLGLTLAQAADLATLMSAHSDDDDTGTIEATAVDDDA